ncbi:neurexin-4-like isoform X2 [Anneissia japonica]|nr:neurexin-4-like isoform X2 [Anneissia japonica]
MMLFKIIARFFGQCLVIALLISIPTLSTEVHHVIRNCEELRIYGFKSDRTSFVIDPDGEYQGVDPFMVECETTGSSFSGRTIITPTCNLVEHVSGYEERGSFIHDITYAMSIDQIVALMTSSTTCRQYMKYECVNSILSDGYWVSRDGSEMLNWGSPTGYVGCMCGYRGDCYAHTINNCNCNENDGVQRLDDGYIDDIATLPVIRLQLGDTGSPSEYGTSTIGPLECAGLTGRFGIMQFYGNVCLSGQILTTYSAMSIIKCLSFCKQHKLCQSFSVLASNDSNAAMTCTLNYQSAREVPDSQLTINMGCKHFEYIHILK